MPNSYSRKHIPILICRNTRARDIMTSRLTFPWLIWTAQYYVIEIQRFITCDPGCLRTTLPNFHPVTYTYTNQVIQAIQLQILYSLQFKL